MIGYPSGQDGAILPARDFPFRSRKSNFAKVQAGAQMFSSQKMFSAKVKRFFSDFSFFKEPENGKTEIVNESESKENINVYDFKKYVLQQKQANTKVKTQSDMKAWKWFCLQQHENREPCDILEDEQSLLLCKFSKL